MVDPIVLDLSGSGVQLTPLQTSSAYFDLHDSGFAVHTGWVGADTGILVEDNNGNGTIDNITELFGNSGTDGFTALEALDANHDGVINAQDPGFANLEVWTDANGNGVTDPGELHSLPDLGIAAINLTTQTVNQAAGGNVIAEIATFVRVDGSTGEVAEAYFDNSQLDSKYTGSYQLNPVTLTLPNLRGYGTLPDLYIAMSLDPTLLQMVQNFASGDLANALNFQSDVRAILYRWAGVDTVAPDSRGPFVDAQELGFLEKFSGETFTSNFAGGADPSFPHQGQILASAFDQALQAIELRLVAQGPLVSLMPGIAFNYDTDSLSGNVNLSQLATAVGAAVPNDQEQIARYWITLAPLTWQLSISAGMSEAQYNSAFETVFSQGGLPFSLSEARLNDVFLGGSSNDGLIATDSGPHYFDGLGDSDYEQSRGGNDTFIFNAGYGHLEINETDFSSMPNNVLQLGAGISASSVTVKATSDGTGLVLTDGVSGDQIKLDSMLSTSPYAGVQTVHFADGTTWTRPQLIQMETTGTTGADSLYGTPGADVFDGKGGNDYESGGGGNDSFVFNAGYGHLEISETDFSSTANNVLQLGAGISASSVRVKATSDGTGLVLTDGVSGDQITLDSMLSTSPYAGVQTVQFADGTMWTQQQLIQMETTGTTGADSLYGTSGADVFDGKGGSDVETGRGGNDTFIFNAGYGHLEINETDFSSMPNNVLQLGAGISASSVTVKATSDGTGLVLTDGVSGDQITLDSMLSTSPYAGVQTVHFADGTTWTRPQLIQMETTGTTGADSLYGTSGADVFDGKGGSDVETGRGGNDTFIFNQGYGHLEVSELDFGSAPGNVLKFGAGLTASGMAVTLDSQQDILLTEGSDQVKLDSMATGAAYYGVQQVQFADGTVWTAGQLLAWARNILGTAGSDVLYGTNGADTFDGNGGSDVEAGRGGNDTFVFNAGYGHLEINETDYSSTANNVLQLGAGISPASLNAAATSNGTGLVLTDGVSGDQITLDSMLSNSPYAGVQTVQFADGTAWSRTQLIRAETTGTAGNETMYGTASAEVFDGKGGADAEYGRGGTDTYILQPGYGPLTVVNGVSSSNTAAGDLSIEGANPNDIWLQRVGNNLQVDLMGSTTEATIQNWFSNTYSQLGELTVSGGSAGNLALDNQVNQLLQAMATFSNNNPGFDPTSSANPIITDSTVLAAVNAAWHQ